MPVNKMIPHGMGSPFSSVQMSLLSPCYRKLSGCLGFPHDVCYQWFYYSYQKLPHILLWDDSLLALPHTIHFQRAVSSIKPMALPSPLMPELFCSWAWSMAKPGKNLLDLWTTKALTWNSLAISQSGCCCSMQAISCRCIGSQQP